MDRYGFDADPNPHQNGNSDPDRHQHHDDPEHWLTEVNVNYLLLGTE